ncbi:MAG: cytochrome d ubiquinol oxidase subunit II [Gemmatimonadetes bacterium]|mgnify:CR=1 FL=1|jgi:cytochrome bd ubiquinol oxidase subunit II|nr:cytochrome d ubiquinol oxidase subunit II [Gemmatimonadota bacterium]MBT6148933.1 cytochrome d ubiquinol oxidase subunit II [Gemmatimonadota bacterium]MBT7861620.1 cytochrome d ubiquinol oxidase subunit II [Gemmatimonadota bacterium]
METTWLIILVGMLIAYVILDGMDFGAGIIHLFVARDRHEGSLVQRAIGPFWDGNEVWLIAAGGVLFMAFPTLYASLFSGFYLPFMLVLWLFIGRGLSIELRHQLDNDLWYRFWDGAFGVCSLLLALLFGIAFGNILRGVNLGGVEAGATLYEPVFFFSPLWTDFFHPGNPGVIDWFSLLIGVIAVLTLAIHGGNWIILKIDSRFSQTVRRFNLWMTAVLLPLMILSLFAVGHVNEAIRTRFTQDLWLALIPLIGLSALLLSLVFLVRRHEAGAFAASSLFIAGMFVAAVVGMYPVVLPSTNGIHPPLTVFSTAAPAYSLHVGIRWWLLAILLVGIYSGVIHWLHRGKIANDDESYTGYH